MSDRIYTDNVFEKNRERFMLNLKIAVNRNLFEKNLISEAMYLWAKEMLEKI